MARGCAAGRKEHMAKAVKQNRDKRRSRALGIERENNAARSLGECWGRPDEQSGGVDDMMVLYAQEIGGGGEG